MATVVPADQLLLDTSSLLYRAYFALPVSLTDEDGHSVNALRGYLDMVATLLRDGALRPGGMLVHTFDDDWRPAPRVAAYPGYKAQRPADPQDLPEQFDVLTEVLDALGATRAHAPGWEADDALATLVARADAGERVDIVTGDRDLLALVRDGSEAQPVVRVLSPVRGVKRLRIFDAAEVEEAYGVQPRQYADLATLRGDPSDGLPGIAGIGAKTAATLLREHGDLASLRRDETSVPARWRTRLRDAGDYLDAMAEVVALRTDVEVIHTRAAGASDRLAWYADHGGLDGPLRRLRAELARLGLGESAGQEPS